MAFVNHRILFCPRCRCVHITDIGIGYISTMLALHTLYLRWCTQIRDFGLQHICGMRSMQILSLAGKNYLIVSLTHSPLEMQLTPHENPKRPKFLRKVFQETCSQKIDLFLKNQHRFLSNF